MFSGSPTQKYFNCLCRLDCCSRLMSIIFLNFPTKLSKGVVRLLTFWGIRNTSLLQKEYRIHIQFGSIFILVALKLHDLNILYWFRTLGCWTIPVGRSYEYRVWNHWLILNFWSFTHKKRESLLNLMTFANIIWKRAMRFGSEPSFCLTFIVLDIVKEKATREMKGISCALNRRLEDLLCRRYICSDTHLY